MTNRENIKLIRELYDYAMWDFHKGNLDEITDKDKAVGKAIDNIEKDLEVFDIIIKHFAGTIKEKEEDGYEYRVSFVEDAEQNYGFVNLLIDEKEYEIIKRWMHDDKG